MDCKEENWWRAFCPSNCWPLDLLEGCGKERSQIQAAQTSDRSEAEHIDAKPPTSEKLRVTTKSQIVGCADTPEELSAVNEHGEKWNPAAAAAQLRCSSYFRWVEFFLFFSKSIILQLTLVYFWINLNLDVLVYKSNCTFVQRWALVCVAELFLCLGTWCRANQQLHQVILGLNNLINVKTSYKSQFCFFFF